MSGLTPDISHGGGVGMSEAISSHGWCGSMETCYMLASCADRRAACKSTGLLLLNVTMHLQPAVTSSTRQWANKSWFGC